jgi:hypothetical protein
VAIESMMNNDINNVLSIHQKSHLNVTALFSIRRTILGLTIIVLGLALLLSLQGISTILDLNQHITSIKINKNQGLTFTLSYGKDELPPFLAYIGQLGYVIALLVGMVSASAVILWQLYPGRSVYREFKELDKEYLSRMYLLVFETSVPRGTKIGEKVLLLARSVFPELRSDYLYLSPSIVDKMKGLWKKKSVKTDQEIIEENSNRLVDSYTLDLALKTPAGYFIVKDFGDKTVTFRDIRQLIGVVRNIVATKWGYQKVFRIVCIGKQYDKPFLERDSLEQLMKKEVLPLRHRLESLSRSYFPIDLLVNEASGFSILWID